MEVQKNAEEMKVIIEILKCLQSRKCKRLLNVLLHGLRRSRKNELELPPFLKNLALGFFFLKLYEHFFEHQNFFFKVLLETQKKILKAQKIFRVQKKF